MGTNNPVPQCTDWSTGKVSRLGMTARKYLRPASLLMRASGDFSAGFGLRVPRVLPEGLVCSVVAPQDVKEAGLREGWPSTPVL